MRPCGVWPLISSLAAASAGGAEGILADGVGESVAVGLVDIGLGMSGGRNPCGISMQASVTVGDVVWVAITWASRRARWEGVVLSGGRAALWAAWVAGVGEMVVEEKRPRVSSGALVRR